MTQPKPLHEISFLKHPSQRVKHGANLMSAIQECGLPVANSCDSDGVCANCVVFILEGNENLSPPGRRERQVIEKEGLSADQRVSCLTKILGPVKVHTTYW